MSMRADLDKRSRMTVDELRKYRERKNRGKAASSEHALQVQCVKWFRMRFPGALIYAIPNGGFRTKTTAGLMRAEGVVSGVCDLHIPIARHGYHTMYIEMKNGKAGCLTDNQREIIAKLKEYGHYVVVCHTFEDFVRETENYLLSISQHSADTVSA